MKKILCLLLVVVLCLTSAPISSNLIFNASAAEIVKTGNCGKSGDNVTYVLYDDGKLIISGEGEIKFQAFAKNQNISDVIIQDGITKIGDYAFEESSITSVVIGKGVKSIGYGAFQLCPNIKTVFVPSNVDYIYDAAFGWCDSLTDLYISDGVDYIFLSAFICSPNLTSVYIGKSVIHIDSSNFAYCEKLSIIHYGGTEESWSKIEDIDNNYNLKNVSIHYADECSFEANKTEPTCTTIGYTTYTCECGQSFQVDYVDMLDHEYRSEITVYPTNDLDGVITYTCECGDSCTEVISKADYQVGDIFSFGSYPQSEVKDESLIAELNSLAPEWTEWISYGYYNGTDYMGHATQGSWMKYVDINHHNKKYRGVKFTKYRPFWTDGTSTVSNSVQYNNEYFTNIVYWFKFESINWRLIDPSTGLILCETIIDSQPYSNIIYDTVLYGAFNDSSLTTYASDYESSSIRKWLNNDFYNTAFTYAEKRLINTTYLNNDGYYTSNGTTGYEKLDSNATEDNIFLLSYNEVRNSDFGFSSDEKEEDASRKTQGSDYAKCQGLFVYSDSESSSDGNSHWILRSPGDSSYNCCYVTYNGLPNNNYLVNSTIYGVRPALKSDIFKHEHSYSSVITKQPTHLELGVKNYTCKCGDTYDEQIETIEGHTYDSKVTKEATHLEEGTLTYTCECGDTYDESIAKLEDHTYVPVVTKEATHLEEGVLTYTCECGDTYDEPIAKLEDHTYVPVVTKEATHLEEGTLTYTCECGDAYDEPIAKIEDHTYVPLVTKEATHLEEGTLTYTCECGDTYDEPIDKLEGHTYVPLVTKEATHLEEGTFTYTCECGDTYDEPIAKLEGHTYVPVVTKEATHLAEGTLTHICACGDLYDESIEKITEHSYKETIVAPTCSSKGFSEFKCECGDYYITNYIGVKPHTYGYSIVKPATHLIEGKGVYTCSICGDHYDEVIAKTKDHTYIDKKVNATCDSQGYTEHICDCGDSYKTDYTAKTDHKDTNSDGVCDGCGYNLIENCNCNCHGSFIQKIIFKITNFFASLFDKSKKVCACGVKH